MNERKLMRDRVAAEIAVQQDRARALLAEEARERALRQSNTRERARPSHGLPQDTIDRLLELRQTHSQAETASILNAEGYRTSMGKAWRAAHVGIIQKGIIDGTVKPDVGGVRLSLTQKRLLELRRTHSTAETAVALNNAGLYTSTREQWTPALVRAEHKRLLTHR